MTGHSGVWPDSTTIEAAAARIRPHTFRTPLLANAALSEAVGTEILLKCENHQAGGAFKARGACNAVFSLSEEEAACGVATHSSGNHAIALARAARLRGIPAHVVMPEGAARAKRAGAAAEGARIFDCPPTMEGRIQTLEAVMADTAATLVHPYEDPRVIAGQGTVGLELAASLRAGDTVLVPLGGGGLISGVGLYLRQQRSDVRLIGVEPSGADDALRSLRAGRVVPVSPNTIADGLRATVGELNRQIIDQVVDDILTVEDEAILAAMEAVWRHSHMQVEPSAVVGVAALMAGRLRPAGRVISILTGGNVDVGAFDFWQGSVQA
ncbi:pyridoxal-phosphate dependent enzyme [Gammaproteobacteria bacterium AB-CW1]|uniref:Pyridoxal-phosphate dependent enzyme n=1 Tax=Natronospira elongata TaxID=3110268 RepID=A0AAP6JCG9_9GAMM|nr:pyridoxal-phosphate dependent enzyme [Gammaproteobacteria bacterium AB-CW1]